MVKLLLVALVVALALPAGARERSDAARARAVSVEVVAVQATEEGRERPVFQQGLGEAIGSAVNHLPFDTYRRLRQTEVTAPFREETSVSITPEYTLHITPLSREDRGRIRMETRLEKELSKEEDNARGGHNGETTKKRTMNALKTTSIVVPGDKLCFGGFSLDQGELLLVLTVTDKQR